MQVTDAHGCRNTSTAYDVTFLGIGSLSAANYVHVYPNPAQGVVHIDWSELNAENPAIRITDMDGRTAVEIAAGQITNSHADIELNTFANGVYLLQITSAKGNVYKKLVVGNE